MREQVASLFSDEVMYGVDAGDWPHAFLAGDRSQPADFAHWAAALSVAFLRWAREPVWLAQVMHVEAEASRLALPWVRAEVLDGAVALALRHILIHCEPPHERADKALALADDLQRWLHTVQAAGLSPTAMRFALAAYRKGIPVKPSAGFIQLGWGAAAERMDSSFTGRTSNIASRLARDKALTKQLLWEAGLPVPEGTVAHSLEQALEYARHAGWPLVVKPHNQDGGEGVTAGILDEAELQNAYRRAGVASGGAVLVERYIAGSDHRMLVVGEEVLAVTWRMRGGVTGDGDSTVKKLVEQTNLDPRRGSDKRSLLIALELDEEAQVCLRQQGLEPDSVPEPGQRVYLRRTANISTGGTAQDVTAQVHPDNLTLARRAARVVGLDIAGIDFICPDIARPWHEVGGAICEVNAQPGFRVHWLGAPQHDVSAEVVDWLFRGKEARIPTAAITGTNGKTTVARMLHHLWLTAGKKAGVVTTQGVWVGSEQISHRNLSGQPGGNILLTDPAVEAAVIEMPRKGLIRFGHPCDRYDVAALLNVQDDHIGVDGVNSLQEMALLKASVLAKASVAVVVNAQDALTLEMRQHAGAARHILVSTIEEVPALAEHLQQGGEAVFVQIRSGSQWIVHALGSRVTPILPLVQVQPAFDGHLEFNVSNALFAVAMAWAQGLSLGTIQQGMATFKNDSSHNLGRFNVIQGLPFTAVLDFAHNPDAIGQLCAALQDWPRKGQLRLAGLNLGNRHRQHMGEVATRLAKVFDHIVLGCDPVCVHENPDYAGENPVGNMLEWGQACLLQAGFSPDDLLLEADPAQAIRKALEIAQPGDLLLILADPYLAMPVIRQMQADEGQATEPLPFAVPNP